MADWQDASRWAWAVIINHSSGALRGATTDLTQPAAVTNLGGVFTKRIKQVEQAVLTQSLSEVFYGFDQAQNLEITWDNSDGAFDQTLEWRLVPMVLYFYDREQNTKSIEFQGMVMQALPQGSEVRFIFGSHDVGLLETFLPTAITNREAGSPFATLPPGGANVPLPVVFGKNVPVRPVAASTDTVSDPGGYDYIVGYDTLWVAAVFLDSDPSSPELERLGSLATAPGSPTYVSSTRFSVTDNQQVRYEQGTYIKFKTTASGSEFLYSAIKLYDATTTPDQVEIYDALFDSGLHVVQLAGDYLLLRGAYQNVTDGLLPVPTAPGADFTAIRLYDPSDEKLHVLCTHSTFGATKHISDAVKEILENAIWGLSSHTTQAVHGGSFIAANTALLAAGLTGAVQGALAYDQQQRRAGDVLNELLMMRGMRLLLNESGEWQIAVDTQPTAAAKTFYHGTGATSAIRIKRILAHGRKPASEAIRTVFLHWEALVRGQSANQKFTPRDYARVSRKAVSAIGQERHYFSQWIRTQAIAELVTHYLAGKLEGADEFLEMDVSLEGRDVTLGETISVIAVPDSIVGDWQVTGIRKTLTSVSLACIRNNTAAYGAASGVISTEVIDVEEDETRRPTGGGSNLLANPEFGPPIEAIVNAPVPYSWQSAAFSTYYPDYSGAVQAQTIGGHYIRIVTSIDQVPLPDAYQSLAPGIHADGHRGTNLASYVPYFYVPSRTILMGSVYCDQTEGVYFAIEYVLHDDSRVQKVIPVTHDPTDVNPLGWARMYGRTRSPDDTIYAVRAAWTIGFSKAGTYQLDAAMLETVPGSARRPSPWRRHKPQELNLTARAEITFTGAGTPFTYTASNLIPAGVKVKGVTSRVSAAITFGTATSYNIGTSSNPVAWGESITNTALNTRTTIADFTEAGEQYYATTTGVVVTGNGGTITSGKLIVQVEYNSPTVPAGP